MGEVKVAGIPFSGSEDSGSSELAGAMPTVQNAIVDARGTIRRRPALGDATAYAAAAAGAAVIGMVSFKGFLVFVDEKRYIFAYKPGVDTLIELSTVGDESTKLAGSGRPSMVAGREMLLIAGGAQIQKWDGSATKSSRLTNTGAGGPPPSAEFICAVAQRLLVSPPGGSGQMIWSGPLEDYEDWDFSITGHAGYTQASAKPDPIKAMLDNTNEIFCVGSETTQVFAPSAMTIDATDPNNVSWFAPSRAINVGTVSPYAVVPYDDMLIMLDRLRRVILTDGRTHKDVSRPMATTLRTLSIEDCWAFRLKFGRFDAVVFQFPTDGYGLIYDVAADAWGEWRMQGRLPNAGAPPSITCAYDWAERGEFLVGLSDGGIAQLDDTTNLDWANYPIKLKVVSGFVNHGTVAKKDCRSVTFMFKRTWVALPPLGSRSLSRSGHVRIWKRDDLGAWDHVEDLELSSDASPCETLRSLGVYRARQWAVEYDGADEIQLVGAEEEFETLGA
jgi:hypothetical protein